MRRISAILLVAAALGLGSVLPARAQSQDQGASLGDIARALRAKKKAELPVITNDNFSHLPQLIRKTEQQALAAGLVPPPVRRSEPEITCSLAFSAQSPSAPAANASIPQDLPSGVLAKLDGPAVISGDTLQVSIYNGSSWDVQEITVGITVVKRENQVAALAASAQLLPASDAGPAPMLKKPDETFLYHLKGSAPPSSTTAFKQALGLNLGPNDEWHWAILQARGLPPATPASGQ
ncbi:MAG TPA: hypothetical protein VJP04_14740 [Terriglobales bacterium]|nr:hypothetical protein [Terriglobales bacterium]